MRDSRYPLTLEVVGLVIPKTITKMVQTAPLLGMQVLRYIDTVFLGRQNHDNQINAKFEKNLVHYIEFGCLLLNE